MSQMLRLDRALTGAIIVIMVVFGAALSAQKGLAAEEFGDDTLRQRLECLSENGNSNSRVSRKTPDQEKTAACSHEGQLDG